MLSVASTNLFRRPEGGVQARRRCAHSMTVTATYQPKPPKRTLVDKQSQPSLVTNIFLRLLRKEAISWHNSIQSMTEEIGALVLPRERGDFRDKALMGISLVIFCIIGAQMYSLYAYWYCSMGLHPVLRG